MKEKLSSFPCDPSPNLRNFRELKKAVKEAKKKQDYEQGFINEQEEDIKHLEKYIMQLTIKGSSAAIICAASSTIGLALSPVTLGISSLVGIVIFGPSSAAAGCAFCMVHVKK